MDISATQHHRPRPLAGLPLDQPVTLAVDLDGTIADYTTAVAAAGALTPAAGPSTYSMIEEGWFSCVEEFLAAHAHVTAHCRDMQLLDHEAPAALRHFVASGHRVVYLTARSGIAGVVSTEDVHASTVGWLTDHGFPVPDQLLLAADKAAHGFDVLVDDAPHNILAVREAGRPVVIRDQTYNRDLTGHRGASMSECLAEVHAALR